MTDEPKPKKPVCKHPAIGCRISDNGEDYQEYCLLCLNTIDKWYRKVGNR